MRRKIFSIRIDPEVWKAAREKGLNISRICENALKQGSSARGRWRNRRFSFGAAAGI
ncbi:type II toxin-antitoxin system CcdA family antitoxin [Candidatus Bathyarchaeota archaeon]|nr:type II toxin-antitoxin system CcdA family antitoxin [Candidatus Bathyarchaeota archaeon]